MATRVLALLLLLCLPVAAEAKCLKDTASPANFTIVFDTSRSVALPQLRVWRSHASRLIDCFSAGDAVRVLILNANSGMTATVADQVLPTLGPHAPLQEKILFRNKLEQARQSIRAAVDGVLSTQGKALESDVFGVFARITVQPRVQSIVVVFSDLLHSVGADNLEKRRVDINDVPSLLNRIIDEQGLTRRSLDGAKFTFVLPSLVDATHAARPLNDVATLRALYTALVKNLGGRVDDFGVDLILGGGAAPVRAGQ